jgi:hypothetical protein
MVVALRVVNSVRTVREEGAVRAVRAVRAVMMSPLLRSQPAGLAGCGKVFPFPFAHCCYRNRSRRLRRCVSFPLITAAFATGLAGCGAVFPLRSLVTSVCLSSALHWREQLSGLSIVVPYVDALPTLDWEEHSAARGNKTKQGQRCCKRNAISGCGNCVNCKLS